MCKFNRPLQKRERTGKEYCCFPFVWQTKIFKWKINYILESLRRIEVFGKIRQISINSIKYSMNLDLWWIHTFEFWTQKSVIFDSCQVLSRHESEIQDCQFMALFWVQNSNVWIHQNLNSPKAQIHRILDWIYRNLSNFSKYWIHWTVEFVETLNSTNLC